MNRQIEVLRKNGDVFPAHLNLTAANVQGKTAFLVGVVNRTAETEADEARRRMEKEVARAAGMTEIATGVLHNIGNVVNSVSVSAELARDRLKTTSPRVSDKVVELLEAKASSPAELRRFLEEDPRGRRVVESLSAIADGMRREKSRVEGELRTLQDHVRQIIAIVSTRQEHAHSAKINADFDVALFLDRAIALSGLGVEGADIRVERSCQQGLRLNTDSHRSMGIILKPRFLM